MKIIITDTNILLDIIDIEAVIQFFKLPYEFHTTNFVIDEILISEQKEVIEKFVNAGQLKVFNLSENEIETVKAFQTKRFFKGLTDKTVLWKAKQLGSPLLTGDGKLRKEAQEQGIKVHGSIWVIENLAINQLIEKPYAVILLEKLKETNSSLPIDEIDKLIKKYSSL